MFRVKANRTNKKASSFSEGTINLSVSIKSEMLISSVRSAISSWKKPINVDLTKLIDKTKTYRAEKVVTLPMTTNRTKKPGDEIFCTPAMIHEMNVLSCNIVNGLTPSNISPLISEIKVKHLAPLGLGGRFLMEAKITDLKPTSVDFDVQSINSETNKVFGTGHISVSIIEHD